MEQPPSQQPPPPTATNFTSLLYNSCKTPFPAAIASTSSWPIASKAAIKPSRASILGFGSAFALGGFIVYDGDIVNGAGFTSAWSILYLMVNGKAAIKQMKPLPLGIAAMVSFNAINYGREFFFPTGKQQLEY